MIHQGPLYRTTDLPWSGGARGRSHTCSSRLGAIRGVEQFDRMDDLEASPVPANAFRELNRAAWVRGGQKLCVGREHVAHLVVQKLVCGFRLRDVIDAGAAAAIVRVAHFNEIQAGYTA